MLIKRAVFFLNHMIESYKGTKKNWDEIWKLKSYIIHLFSPYQHDKHKYRAES